MRPITLRNQSIYTGNLILVNAKHGYHPEKHASLIPVLPQFPNVLMQHRPSILLFQLMKEIRGWQSIVPVSGWRSFEEQQDIWDTSLAENGSRFTHKYVALPGHSEHQTGLAIDLGLLQEEIDFIRPAFPYEGICQLFRERAADYGFIERYPLGKEAITGIAHEPWHFRYVGVPHGAIMKQEGLTFEEYIGFLKQFPHGQTSYHFHSGNHIIDVSYLPAASGDFTETELSDHLPYAVSGNNVDGFIITEWRRHYAQKTELLGA